MGTYINLEIVKQNGNRVSLQNRHTLTRITSAQQVFALNADDTLNITVESPYPQAYEIGDGITVFGRDYRLNRLPTVQRSGANAFVYGLEFEGVQYDLLRVTYDLTIDTTNNTLQDVQGDSLTGDLRRFMTVLVANANRVFPGKWALGICPTDTIADKTLTFGEFDNCLLVLQSLCSQENFNVEYSIENDGGVYTINLQETVGQTLPYTFKYGRGNGLYELTRENVSSANIVTRLKVYGSTENITKKYRADRLCLPGKSKGQSYIEKLEPVSRYGVFEGRKDFDVKPTFTGTVGSVVAGNVLQFVDATFPFDLNAKDEDGETLYLIAGLEAKIHFNTGNLAGYDFTLQSYDHATHTFTLNKLTDDRGDVFPSETSAAFQFSVGDKYKITDIAYSPEIEEAAEQELANKADEYYNQNSQPKVQYGLAVTKQWLKDVVGAQNDVVANVFSPGDYLHVVDEDIAVDKSLRIKSFSRNVLDPYDYDLTISDIAVTTSTTNRVLAELINIEKLLTINNLRNPAKARANWRSSREVLDMVFDPDGDYYTEKIKPNSIDTLALSVGAKSMQFGLTNTVFEPNYQGNKNLLRWSGGTLTHYTINNDAAVTWALTDGQVTLDSDASAYYIYAQCAKDSNGGSIVVTTQQFKVDVGNYYYFWIGVLNSVDTDLNARSISLTYGFTTVNGGFIKTGRIEAANGDTYFDLDNSEIGGRIVFNSGGQNKTLEELGEESLANKNYIDNTLPGILSEIQQQIDGQIEQFFYDYDPTLSNVPANEWTTEVLKESHLGDLFYNTASGAVFRFIKNGTTYSWQELQDSEVAQALALANEALALAQTKRRVFTSTPTTPYDIGDLWVQGSDGDIMRCKVARSSGSYTSSDWERASRYTDDSALTTFINGSFERTISNLTKQIDGKIESWFQEKDPSSGWFDGKTKSLHVGDIWFNTAKNTMWRYDLNNLGLYNWVQINDQQAINAYELASRAQDTADGKRRVFVSTPYPPYDVGDLWTDGTDLRRCVTARASGTYQAGDWVIATAYDNTKTTIDGGLVTSGTIQVAGDKASILAGITGNGSSEYSVRFWAGEAFENRSAAPFRVTQSGAVTMNKAIIEGDVIISGFIKTMKTTITSSNWRNYAKYNSQRGKYELDSSRLMGNIVMDISLNSIISDGTLFLSMYVVCQQDGKVQNVPDGMSINDYIGAKMSITNNTSYTFGITGLTFSSYDSPPMSVMYSPGSVIYLECVVRFYNGEMQIGWLRNYAGGK